MSLRKVLLIKYTNCTEIHFAYNMQTIQIVKNYGANFSKASRTWYISTNMVDDLIIALTGKVDVIVDELGFDKSTLIDNPKYLQNNSLVSNRSISYDDVENNKENTIIKVLLLNDELRVKLNVPRNVFADLMSLGCTRDYNRHELVFKDPEIFYNYCKNSNTKFEIIV